MKARITTLKTQYDAKTAVIQLQIKMTQLPNSTKCSNQSVMLT